MLQKFSSQIVSQCFWIRYVNAHSDNWLLHHSNRTQLRFSHSGNLVCNSTAVPNSNITYINNDTCVNWNYYYTECKGQGNNPFQGTISFDNIGLAWVAIFLVSALVTRPTFVPNNLRMHVYTYSNMYMWHGIFLPSISEILSRRPEVDGNTDRAH